jgi:hypothetical protein
MFKNVVFVNFTMQHIQVIFRNQLKTGSLEDKISKDDIECLSIVGFANITTCEAKLNSNKKIETYE